MREAGAVKIVFTTEEHLRFILQTPERRGVNDPISIDLKCGAVVARSSGLIRLHPISIKRFVKFVLHVMTEMNELIAPRQRIKVHSGGNDFVPESKRPIKIELSVIIEYTNKFTKGRLPHV